MLDYEIMMLSDWEEIRSRKIHNQIFSILTIYASFVDRDSLQICLKLTDYSFWDENFKNRQIQHEGFQIYFIFLPISRIDQVNRELLQRFQRILLNRDQYQIDREFTKIVNEAMQIIQNNQKTIQYKISFHEITISKANETFEMNQMLFGKGCATFLAHYSHFPVLSFQELYFSGIPLNFSLDVFIQKVISPELNQSA